MPAGMNASDHRLDMCPPAHRSHLNNVFWLNIFVGASFQILDNQQVACGLKLGPAVILNQNPIFETASNYFPGAMCRFSF
jgi:hypothetical protein